MFEKFKQLRELKKLQDTLAKEKVTVEKEGVRVIMNGKMQVEEVQLNPELDKAKHEKIVRACINEAMQKIQFKAAENMARM